MVSSDTSKTKLPVSRQVAAAIVLMQSGVSDFALIASAVGLTQEEVERIDTAEDSHVRRLAVSGVPDDFVFRLRTSVACPSCGRRIYLIPCLACRIARSYARPRRRGRSSRLRSEGALTRDHRFHKEAGHGPKTR